MPAHALQRELRVHDFLKVQRGRGRSCHDSNLRRFTGMRVLRYPGRFLIGLLLVVAHADPSVAAPKTALFAQQVAPLLARRCLSCHNRRERKGEFSLESAAELLDGSYVIPGSAAGSRLVEVITGTGGEPPSMPKRGEPLTEREVELIRRWIDGGADWPQSLRLEAPTGGDYEWWSFTSLSRPELPERTAFQGKWSRTPIDDFIVRQRQRRGLSGVGQADRRTLIRRVTYDLIGLPPSPEEVTEFTNSTDPLAYERLVDRLLASPRYGERWGRHWLDVVQYADTCGYDKDKLRPHAWPYRDYVIRSFNGDKPFDRFVQEQVAGDVLFPGEADGILGLGFLAAGPWDFIGHVEVPESKIDGRVARNLDRDNMVSNTLNTFISMTVQCARCHNHKFDPFTQQHYYGVQAVFAAVDRADRPYGLSWKAEQQYRSLHDERASLTTRREETERDLRAAGGGELLELDRRIAESAGSRAGESGAELERAEQRRKELLTGERIGELYDQLQQLDLRKRTIERQLSELSENLVYAAATHFPPQSNFRATLGTPRAIQVLHRGSVQQPGDLAPPGAVPLARGGGWQFSLPETHAEGDRRAALATWLVRRDHPLTWRSIVNRVWQYHFGQGIVASPNDFGRMGQLPTHPELLDWLAVEFRDRGRSLKKLHRSLVMSSVYRQSSEHDAGNAELDAGNRYLWRMNRRRLSAEEIRDSVLSVSGQLDTRMGGTGDYLFVLEKTDHSPHYEYHKFDPSQAASHRRSIYRFVVRSQPDPFMTTLDCADSSQSTPQRNETLTSLQALSLLNNDFSLAMANFFAARLENETLNLPEAIQLAMNLVAARDPRQQERRLLHRYAETHGLPNLCRVLFNLSEFVYLD